MIVGFMLSLRGEEVPLVSLTGLIDYWAEGRKPTDDLPPHVMIPLQGRFKGEQGTRWHLVPILDGSRSKIPARRWPARLVFFLSSPPSLPVRAQEEIEQSTLVWVQ